jgi:hypothetical protein
MKQDTFDKARRIVKDIERLESFRQSVSNNPNIQFDNVNINLYLSWIDSDDQSLRDIILKWCEDRIESLQKQLADL